MDFGEVEQVELDLILQNGEIGAIFGEQLGSLQIAELGAELVVEGALAVAALFAEIVEHFIQILLFI